MRRDGTEFPVELTITRIALPGPPTFTGYLRDITDRVPGGPGAARVARPPRRGRRRASAGASSATSTTARSSG